MLRNLEQIHIAHRHTHVLGLPARKSAGKVRVAKHARRLPAVQRLLERVGVCLGALRRQLALAVPAVAAGNLKRRHVPLAHLDLVTDAAADQLRGAAKLVAQNVALFHLEDRAVHEVQVGAAQRAAGDFEDDVAVFYKLGLGDVGCQKSLFLATLRSQTSFFEGIDSIPIST